MYVRHHQHQMMHFHSLQLFAHENHLCRVFYMHFVEGHVRIDSTSKSTCFFFHLLLFHLPSWQESVCRAVDRSTTRRSIVFHKCDKWKLFILFSYIFFQQKLRKFDVNKYFLQMHVQIERRRLQLCVTETKYEKRRIFSSAKMAYYREWDQTSVTK